MPEQEDQLSPEETLLQTMQSGESEGADGDAGAEAPKASEPPRKLRLAEDSGSPKGDTAGPSDGLIGASTPVPDAEGEDEEVEAATPVAAKHGPRSVGIGTLNKVLAVAVLVVVCFVAFEVFSSVQAMQVPTPPPPEIIEWGDEPEGELPPLEQLLKSFRSRPILRSPEQVAQPDQQPTQPQQPAQPPAALKHVRDNFDLIGLSGSEAIVLDREAGKMHFVKMDQEITFKGQTLTVKAIGADQVTFTDGVQDVTVK